MVAPVEAMCAIIGNDWKWVKIMVAEGGVWQHAHDVNTVGTRVQSCVSRYLVASLSNEWS